MSAIVLVHGIGQTQKSADTLEASWIPALAGGVRAAGDAALADRLWRDSRPGTPTARMAFYADLFTRASRQGPEPSTEAVDSDAAELEDALAVSWLRAAAERAAHPDDRATARVELAQLDSTATPQGPQALARGPIRGLSRVRWFAVGGQAFAQRFIQPALREVSTYLTNPAVRRQAQDRVLARIDHDTRVVIGHSLGSVVAYEALHQTQQPVVLVTIGSPLGLRTVIYDRLAPTPPAIPSAVTNWFNYADRDDLVAATTDLAPLFPTTRPGQSLTTDTSLDNGSRPHSGTHYLVKPVLAAQVIAALTGPSA